MPAFLQGRREDAVETFERLLSIRNDVGLLSEEYDPVACRLIGNFPQAFSHVGLVNTAFALEPDANQTVAGPMSEGDPASAGSNSLNRRPSWGMPSYRNQVKYLAKSRQLASMRVKRREDRWLMPTAMRRGRVVISGLAPIVDCGKYPIKRAAGESVTVDADVFADGHDAVSCVLLYRRAGAVEWTEAPMKALPNDRWRGEFLVPQVGEYRYTVEGWVDAFQSWRRDLMKRIRAGQDVSIDLLAGAQLVAGAAARAPREDADKLR